MGSNVAACVDIQAPNSPSNVQMAYGIHQEASWVCRIEDGIGTLKRFPDCQMDREASLGNGRSRCALVESDPVVLR
jgi:hypothetical protein